MPAVQALAAQYSHTAVVHAIRSLLSEMRQAMLEGAALPAEARQAPSLARDRKSTRLNSSHGYISYAVFCLKKKNTYRFLLVSFTARCCHGISVFLGAMQWGGA